MTIDYEQLEAWSIVPTKSESCFDSKCFNIFNPRLITVFPDQINRISLGFQMTVPPGYLVRVKYHLSDKPWKILNKYLDPKFQTSVHLTIITPYEIQLQPGEILTHIQLQPITGVLASIYGKCISLLPSSSSSLLPINKCTCFLDSEDIYFSDPDESEDENEPEEKQKGEDNNEDKDEDEDEEEMKGEEEEREEEMEEKTESEAENRKSVKTPFFSGVKRKVHFPAEQTDETDFSVDQTDETDSEQDDMCILNDNF